MGSIFINGSKFAVSELGASVDITAITNANPPVVSCATPPANGSIIMLRSNWSDINNMVVRTANATADSFEISGVDTTDTTSYPPGEGVGSFSVADNFVSLIQVRDFSISGGEQQYYEYQYVDDKSGRMRRKPTYKNSLAVDIPMDYDPEMPWYKELIRLDARRKEVAMRVIYPDGAINLYGGYISFNKVPTGKVNENLQVSASFSIDADPVFYGEND